jgi:hypothetical protein
MGADEKRKWPWVVAAVVAVVFVGLAVGGRLIGDTSTPPETSPTSTTDRSRGTSPVTTSSPGKRDGKSAASKPANATTSGSAAEAATTWTETVSGLVYETAGDARAQMMVLSSSETAIDSELDALKQRQKNVAEADDEALIWSQFAPLGVKETTGQDRTTVDVWGVWVQSADPVVEPVSVWVIWSVDLEKDGTGWTVIGSDRQEGPAFGLSLDTVPAGADLASDLGGFEPVGVR